MLEQQRFTHANAIEAMRAHVRVVWGGERTNAAVGSSLEMQHAAVAALLATILLSGYMVAVG